MSNSTMSTEDKIELVVSHIKNVQRGCYKVGLKLIKSGEIDLGRKLIANGLVHDNSKLKGIEFEHLIYGDPLLPEVISHHHSINPHHPEHWSSIHEMPRVFVAEMVCDWHARSYEFGSNLREWVDGKASTKFGFNASDPVYSTIQEMISLLLDTSFD